MENIDLSAVWPEWKIVRRINRGSFGTVYEAVRSDYGVESHAAIKMISIPQDEMEFDSLISAEFSKEATKTYLQEVVNDFTNEIQIMESFKGSQNIVSVEDYKVIEKTEKVGWDIYIRMELLTPLNAYLSDKTLSEREVINLGCDICSALERCAQRGVIHRDIKPGNIFINEFGDFKLGDFGIARRLENMTGGLSQKGTYNYMAPEVKKGFDYDSRVDIYSLGIVLYLLMNKQRLPFLSTEKKLLAPRDLEMANRRRFNGEPLPAPSNASPEMAEVILCACEPDPAKRFASAEEMKSSLKSVADGTYRMRGGIRQSAQYTENRRAIKTIGEFGEESINKKTIVIVTLLVFFLAAGGCLFASLRNKGNENQNPEESEIVNSEAEPTKEGEIDERIEENIYENISDDASEGPISAIVSNEVSKAPFNENDSEEIIVESIPDTRRSVDDVYPPSGPFFTYNEHTYCFYNVYAIDEYEYGNVFDVNGGGYDNVSRFCREQDGHLAIINSYEENEALFSETQKRYDHTVFFGLSDHNNEGVWTWDDGTENTLELWSFKSGYQQPDNGHGYSYENYAEFDYDKNNPARSDNTGRWNDAVYLKNSSIFICEWDYLLKGLSE